MPSDIRILPRRRWLWSFARIIFAMVWTLFACEMFLRIFAPQAIMPRGVSYSDMGIRVNTPNDNYWQTSPEVKVHVHINSQGMRADRDIPLDKPADVKRIVVLGDSFGLGAEVNLQDTFAARMADRLTAAGQKTEIVNLSVAGYGTAEELIVLRRRGFAFHPDMVLVAWHPTDLNDNMDSHLFALKDGAVVPDHPSYYPGLKTRKRLETIPCYQWIDRNCQLYTFIREITAGQFEKAVAPDVGQKSIQPGPVSGPPSEKDRLAVALLSQIRTECAAYGIPLMILDIPSRETRTAFHSDFPYEAARGLQLDVVSPLDEFKKHVGEKLFWEHGNFHLSLLGSRIVGDVLVDHVLANRLLNVFRKVPELRRVTGIDPPIPKP